MRFTSLLLAIGLFGATAGDELEKARREFAATVQKARADHDAVMLAAAEKLRARIQTALERATKEHRIEAAKELIAELEGLGAGSLPVFGGVGNVVPGTWRVRYHPNGAVRTYVVKASGEVSCAEEALQGRIQRMEAGLFLDLDDGKLERLTFAGGRIFVEHFAPKSQFPLLAEVGIGESVAGR